MTQDQTTTPADAGTQPPVDNAHVAPGAEPFTGAASNGEGAALAGVAGVGTEVIEGQGVKSALEETSNDDNDAQMQEARAKAAAVQPVPPTGAPVTPEGFALVGAVTVSKSKEDGSFFIQFDDGTPAAGAQNASQVGMIASQYLGNKAV